jgi:predicted anti-sigma-YlaC factor YlaD
MLKDKDCFMFKDLYKSYIDEEVEEETSEWMKDHLLKCDKCKEWAQEFDEESIDSCNEKALNNIYVKQEDDREMQVLKRAKIVLISALVIVVILAIWMSLWIFA